MHVHGVLVQRFKLLRRVAFPHTSKTCIHLLNLPERRSFNYQLKSIEISKYKLKRVIFPQVFTTRNTWMRCNSYMVFV